MVYFVDIEKSSAEGSSPKTPRSEPRTSDVASEPQAATTASADKRSPSPDGENRKRSLIQTIFDRLRHTPASLYSVMSDHRFCRICHEGDVSAGGGADDDDVNDEPLISPCKCSGSVGLIHRSCLEKWLSTANEDKCEICHHKFDVMTTSKSFKQWMLGVRFGGNKKNVTADVVCFFVLTPLAAVSTYLCAAGAVHYFKLADHRLEAIGLVILGCFLAIIYFVWTTLSLRFHLNAFREWQKKNQDIRLVAISTVSGTRTEENV